ncbi:aminotransferase [Clostridia bacterium]|nr:aminotransferase [Clostridia bacterium]
MVFSGFSDNMRNMKPSVIREIFKSMGDPTLISFAAGNPAAEAFPTEAVAALSADIFRDEPINALQYSITEGYPPLRDWLKNDLTAKNSFRAGDDLIITAGAQQAFDLAAKVFCNPGDCIICEEPSFIGALNTFRSHGARLVGVPLDDSGEGIDLSLLERALIKNPRLAFIYLIPNFHNPTGRTMSLARRKAVLELAHRYKVLIFEDNPYGDIRFSGVEIPSIRSLDTEGCVMYGGTFSKTLAPGLRVGFLAAAENIITKATVAEQTSTVHANIWAQMLCYRFVTECDFPDHLEHIRRIYRRKCSLMLNSLKFSLPMDISLTEPDGGLFIWATLPESDVDMLDFVKRAMAERVAVVPGNAFCVNEAAKSRSFRLNFSTPTDSEIEIGVARLAKLANELFK